MQHSSSKADYSAGPLFDDDQMTSSSYEPPSSALLITNHMNLMYMIAAGLIMPPDGFAGKYYRDTLNAFPGWIPLFVDRAFEEAINISISEADYLKPCLAEVSLEGLSGEVAVIRGDGFEKLQFPEEIRAGEKVILVPAPLPVSWIRIIHFQSEDEKKACESEARDFGNVLLSSFTLKALKTKTPFSKSKIIKESWPPLLDLEKRSVSLEMPLSAGGVMAMLFHFANKGMLGVETCRLAFDPEDESKSMIKEPILSGIVPWILTGSVQEAEDSLDIDHSANLQDEAHSRVFWEAVNNLVNRRINSSVTNNSEKVLLDMLETAISRETDPRLKRGFTKLRNTLESLTGLGEHTVTELFKLHTSSLSHAMTLCFLRKTCAELRDFTNPLLSERDWLAAAILFGAREGWLPLPLNLRDFPGLTESVSHRMAQLSHQIDGTGIDLGAAPSRTRPLRELFGDGSNWGKRENSAALLLAQRKRWNCVQTRITFAVGTYELKVERGKVEIALKGEPTIQTEVDATRFFDFLEDDSLSAKVEKKIREELNI